MAAVGRWPALPITGKACQSRAAKRWVICKGDKGSLFGGLALPLHHDLRQLVRGQCLMRQQ